MTEAQSEAATSLYVPTIDTIVAQAYRRAGLLNAQQSATAVQRQVGYLLLANISDQLSAEGLFMRAIQVGYVTLVAGQNQYSLPEAVYDVVGDGAYIEPSQTAVPFSASSETPVIMKPRSVWQGLSTKSAQSQPTIGYFARQAPLGTLYLWPTPSAAQAGGLVRFFFHQTRPDVTNGSNTLPFERYWSEYFVWELAHLLAVENSLDLGRVSYLSGQAEQKKMAAKASSRQQVPQQASLNHQTGWSRARR